MNETTLFCETDKLYIRIPRQTDVNYYYQLLSNADVMRYIDGVPRTKTIVQRDLTAFIQHY